MTCITTVTGKGGDCATGGAAGAVQSWQFDGYWVPVSHSTCGHTWISLAKDGVKHPNANYWSFAIASFSYTGCSIDPNQPCDCINGGCVPKTTYNTPGVFANLAACESGCAKNSNCVGECVSAEELAALQQAANNLQGRLCG